MQRLVRRMLRGRRSDGYGLHFLYRRIRITDSKSVHPEVEKAEYAHDSVKFFED